jgi:hypothetical protein
MLRAGGTSRQKMPTAALLVKPRNDPDWRVRYEIVNRIDLAQFAPFAEDPDPIVREAADRRRGGNRADKAAKEIAG